MEELGNLNLCIKFIIDNYYSISMDALTKIMHHFIAHQDEYVNLFPGKYVVIRADFRTAGAFDSKEDARKCAMSITDMPAAFYPAVPGEKAYTITLRSI